MKNVFVSAILLISGINAYAYEQSQMKHITLYDKDTVALYLKGQLTADAPTEFMLDTGSGYVTINKKSLRSLKSQDKARYLRDITALMADGRRKRVSIYEISELELGDGCIIKGVEAAVMPGATRNILGMSALKKAAPFTVSLSPPRLTLQNCGAINQSALTN